MGRQIPIVATLEDEALLLRFLQSTADIAIFVSHAPTAEGLWVTGFSPTLAGHWTYHLWNRAFPWAPTYGTVDSRAHDRSHVGWSYVRNTETAPVLELSRSGSPPNSRPGRIYWAKEFAAPHGLAYDPKKFEKWFGTIARWVRKHGVRHEDLPLQPYLLPQANELRNAGTA